MKEIDSATKQMSYQLEQWCNLYCDEIIFDSNVNNWSIRTSTLNEIIKGRSHLMFVIEDDNDEMFGFYFNKQIPLNENYSESDDKSFYFILNSKRKTSPMKFNQRTYCPYGIHLFCKRSYKLIRLGDISLYKEGFKEKSYCRGINGQLFFIPKRILVIQMG